MVVARSGSFVEFKYANMLSELCMAWVACFYSFLLSFFSTDFPVSTEAFGISFSWCAKWLEFLAYQVEVDFKGSWALQRGAMRWFRLT